MAEELIPQYQSENWAPLQPLLDIKEGNSEKTHYLQDAIKELLKHFKRQNDEVWREIYSAGQLVELFTQGKHLLLPNPYTGGWKILRPRGEDESTKRSMNLMQFYMDNILTKWMTSDPDVKARPGNNSDNAILGARAADTVLEHYEEKFFTPEFNEQEGLAAACYGTYLNKFSYDSGAYGPLVLNEIFETRPLTLGSGYGVCGDCGTQGSADQFASGCPQCQSPDTQVQQPETLNVRSAVGKEQKRMGDLTCKQIPILATKWDLQHPAEKSSWFLYQRRVPVSAIKAIMGDIHLPGDGSGPDVGLDILHSLAYAGQAVSGRSIGGLTRKPWEQEVTIFELWMSVENYGHINLRGNEQTISGQQIPTGKLSDIFPEHVCVIGLNDEVILGLYDETHKNQLVTGTWHAKPHSGAGRGMVDTVEVQKRFNTLDSQILAYLQSTATPSVLYNQALIQSDEMQYLGTPNKNIPVDMRTLPEGSSISDAIWQFKPGTMSGQIIQYNQEFLTHMFQLSSMVTDFTGGLNPVVRNYTATGANISASLSNSLFTPMLQIKSSVRKRGAKIILDLYRDYFPMERSFVNKGKHGRMQAISFKGIDICDDLVLEVVKNSEIPKNSYSQREDLSGFFQVMGGAEGYIALKEKYPDLMQQLEQLWNIEATQSYDTVTGLNRYRLTQLMAQVQRGILDPAILAQQGFQPPISQFEPQQHEKALWWQDFLDTDEGQMAPLELRLVVEMLIQQHFTNAGMQQTSIALQMGQAEAAQMAPPGALQLLGQHMAPQPPPKAAGKQEDPEEAAKNRIVYRDAPPTVAAQMEKDAGFSPGSVDQRPPVMAAKAQMIVAKKPAPKPAGAKPKPTSKKKK